MTKAERIAVMMAIETVGDIDALDIAAFLGDISRRDVEVGHVMEALDKITLRIDEGVWS